MSPEKLFNTDITVSGSVTTVSGVFDYLTVSGIPINMDAPADGSFRGASALKTDATQTIITATPTAVTWNAAPLDTDGFFNLGSNTRFTIPPGITKVRLSANSEWVSPTVTTKSAYFMKNGSEFGGTEMLSGALQSSADKIDGPVLTAPIPVEEGDYFELFVYHNLGSDADFKGNSRTWMSLEVLEPNIAFAEDLLAVSGTFTQSLTVSGVPVSTGTGGGAGTITDINEQSGPSITITGTGNVFTSTIGNAITIDGSFEVASNTTGDASFAVIERTTNQTIPHLTVEPLSCDNAVTDTDGYYAGGQPTRLTVPADLGIRTIEVGGQIQWQKPSTDGMLMLTLYMNGGGLPNDATVKVDSIQAVGQSTVTQIQSTPVQVQAGDYFELNLVTSLATPQSLDITGGAGGRTHFWIKDVTPRYPLEVTAVSGTFSDVLTISGNPVSTGTGGGGSADTLQDAFDNGDGTITTTAGKPLHIVGDEYDGNVDFQVTGSGKFTEGLSVGSGTVWIDSDKVDTPSLFVGGSQILPLDEVSAVSGRAGAVIKIDSNQSVTTATNHIITWDTVLNDEGGWVNLGADDEVFTVPVGLGITHVRLLAFVMWAASASANRRLVQFRRNGSTLDLYGAIIRNAILKDDGGGPPHQHVISPIVSANPGDTFSVLVWHDHGSDLTIQPSTGNASTWFSIEQANPIAVSGTQFTSISGSFTESLTVSGVPVNIGEGVAAAITDINDQTGPSVTVTGVGNINTTTEGNVITISGVDVVNLRSKNFSGVVVSRESDSNQAISGNTLSRWTDEIIDTDGFYDSGTNTRLTIPSGKGIKKVVITVCPNIVPSNDPPTDSYVSAWIPKNGVSMTPNLSWRYPMTFDNGLNIGNTLSSPVIEVADGDYFELYVATTAGGSPTLWSIRSYFSIEVVERDAPFELGEFTAVSGTYSQSLTISGVPVSTGTGGGGSSSIDDINGIDSGSVTITGAGNVETTTVGNVITVSGVPELLQDDSFKNLFHVRDIKANSTSGGSASTNTFHIRDLNTVVTNDIEGASLSANQISLSAGTYYTEWSAPAYQVGEHNSYFYLLTPPSVLIQGSSEKSDSSGGDSTNSIGGGKFTLTEDVTDIEIRHYTKTAQATNGLGIFTNASSFEEMYTDVRIWKIDDSGTSLNNLTVISGTFTDSLTVSGVPVNIGESGGGASTLQDAYDGGDGTITTTGGKPFELDGTGELVAVTGTFTEGLTVGTGSTYINDHAVTTTSGVFDNLIIDGVPITSPADGSFRGATVIKNGADQAVPFNSGDPIEFTDTVFDTDGFFNIGSSDTKFTIPAGITKVRLSSICQMDAAYSPGQKTFYFTKNGAIDSGRLGMQSYSEEPRVDVTMMSTPVSVVEGDYFEFNFYHSHASDIGIQGSSKTSMSIEVLEPNIPFAEELIAVSGTFSQSLTVSGVPVNIGEGGGLAELPDPLVAASGVFTESLTVSGVPVQVGVSETYALRSKNFSGATVHRELAASGTITLQDADTGSTRVDWGTITVDTDGFIDLGTGDTDSIFTIPAGLGIKKVQVEANFTYLVENPTTDPLFTGGIKKNGDPTEARSFFRNRETAGTHSYNPGLHMTTGIEDVVDGDTFSFTVRSQNAGVDATIADNDRTWFSIQVLERDAPFTMGEFIAASGTFTESLTVSGVPVSTGTGGGSSSIDDINGISSGSVVITGTNGIDTVTEGNTITISGVSSYELRSKNFAGAYVTKDGGSAQSINPTATVAEWDGTEVYDTDGFFDSGDNTKLTIPAGKGIKKVKISFVLRCDPNGGDPDADSTIIVNIDRNGVLESSGTQLVWKMPPIAEGPASTSYSYLSPVLEVADGDYFTLDVSFNNVTGGSGPLLSNIRTWYQIEVVERDAPFQLEEFTAVSGTFSDSLTVSGVPVHVGDYMYSKPVFRGAMVIRTTDQNILDSTSTKVLYDTVAIDTEGFIVGGDESLFVIPAGVTKVKVSAQAYWKSDAGQGQRQINIRDMTAGSPGAGGFGASILEGPITATSQQAESYVIDVYEGQKFGMLVAQQSGGDLEIQGNALPLNYMQIEVIESYVNWQVDEFTAVSGTFTDTLTIAGVTVNVGNLPTASGSLNAGDLWVDTTADHTLKVTPN